MKRLLFIALMCYASSVNAQQARLAVPDNELTCPEGYIFGYTFQLDIFNFHKPRTGCTSGFGLCFRLAVGVKCIQFEQKALLSSGKVSGYARLAKSTAELHLPLEMKNDTRFSSTNMTQFEIDPNTLSFVNNAGLAKWVKGGVYPVTIMNNEYIIKLPIN